MQYLVSVITDTAGLATPEEMAAIAPSTATVIDNRGEEAMFTDVAVPRPLAGRTAARPESGRVTFHHVANLRDPAHRRSDSSARRVRDRHSLVCAKGLPETSQKGQQPYR